ncbi:MAG TPA: Flp pilus assembly protein CpaB [Gaiellaceae bacterium]|nr:Flp pilus assembly protein CpaB [Gaiellaceae bacterium]
MTYRIRNIGIAVALAIVAALLTTFYVTNYKRTVQHGEGTVSVYVASHDIPLGTSGADVAQRNMMRVEHVTRRSVVPGAIAKPDQIDKLVAVEPIYAGEQVSTRRFRTAEEQGVRAQLKGNMRALQIAGGDSELLAGTVNDGDHVDVVGSWEFPEGKQVHVARVVLRDLLVLKAPDTSKIQSKIGANPNEPFTVMLAVTDAQAQKLWWLVKNGDWALQLRPITNAADSPDSFETSGSLLADGLRAGARRRLTGGK